MPRENNSYKKLEAHLRQIGALNQAAEMLYWDMSTMMPAGGEEARSEQLTALNTLCHGMLTAPEVSDLLDSAEIDKNLDNWQQANLKETLCIFQKVKLLDHLKIWLEKVFLIY